MWFGCHPLRADFIKLKLTGANRLLPAALWVVIVHQSPHNGKCRVDTTVAFCHRSLNPHQPQRQQQVLAVSLM